MILVGIFCTAFALTYLMRCVCKKESCFRERVYATAWVILLICGLYLIIKGGLENVTYNHFKCEGHEYIMVRETAVHSPECKKCIEIYD